MTREKLPKILSFEKGTCKTLMKLTHLNVCESFPFSFPSFALVVVVVVVVVVAVVVGIKRFHSASLATSFGCKYV